MNVIPVNSAGYQANFNGYLDKSLTKFINKSANQAIKKELKQANKQGKAINTESLASIRERADKCITTLQTAVENLHSNSYLCLKHQKHGDFFILNLANSKLNKGVDVGFFLDSYYKFGIYKPEIIIDCIKNHIEKMKKFERSLFEDFANHSNVKFPMRRAKKADKLALEFGFTPNYAETWKTTNKAKKQTKKAFRSNQKNIEKENIKTAKKYIK